jgi:hypothetical protein
MTKQELLNLDHLKIARETVFVHIHTEDGWIMTSWKDGDDIKEYSGSVCYYMPIRDDYEDYRIITVEEHNRLTQLQNEEIEKENRNRLDSINNQYNE